VAAVNLSPDVSERLREIDQRHKLWSAQSAHASRRGSANVAAHDRAWLLILLDDLLPESEPRPEPTEEEHARALRALHELTRAALREQGPLSVPGLYECQHRNLLEVPRKYPGTPVVTDEGTMMLSRLLDLFERKS
jgi:hypothetical protein